MQKGLFLKPEIVDNYCYPEVEVPGAKSLANRSLRSSAVKLEFNFLNHRENQVIESLLSKSKSSNSN